MTDSKREELDSSNGSSSAAAIGARIVQARKELDGMKQEELADLIDVSVRSMQAYESGEVIPYRKMKDLERVLGRSMAWILHGDSATEQRDQQLDEIRAELAKIAEINSEILEFMRSTRG